MKLRINEEGKVVLTEEQRHALDIPEAVNDVYLFDGAHLPGFKEPILASGYSPFNTNKEMLAKTKKECKAIRKKVKPASLGFGYGLGWKKYMDDMHALGYSITEAEARAVHKAYWKLYKGCKEYEAELKRQWRKNRGWILNGIGRPIGVHDDFLHDIINRSVQSTGHDLLVYWIQEFRQLLDNEGIEWYPIIIDFHDESIIEVREDQAKRAHELLHEGFVKVNERMGNVIPLTGDGMVCNSFADVKMED